MAEQQTKEYHDFKKQLKALAQFRGRGTELVSLYISPGYPVAEVTNKLREEFGQAANIKSASTRKNVQSALEKLLHFLKGVQKPPANGIAVFAGNVSDVEGRPDIQLFSVVPPVPLRTQFYRCESTFVLEPLEELLEQTGTYGLVVLDGKEATVALLKGTELRVIKKLQSTAHQKVHKGGQSAARYQRIHDEVVEVYYKRIGEAMDAFLGVKGFKGVIVGGPGPAKEDFMKLKPFNYQLEVLGVVDTGYTDEYGLQEILEKSGDLIAEQESIKEKKLVDEFMREVSKDGLVAYGLRDVQNAVESKQARKLLVSAGLSLRSATLACSQCGEKAEKILDADALAAFAKQPHADGGKWSVARDDDVAEALIHAAEQNAIPVEIISTNTAEGRQFLGTFKGLGAFLRYR